LADTLLNKKGYTREETDISIENFEESIDSTLPIENNNKDISIFNNAQRRLILEEEKLATDKDVDVIDEKLTSEQNFKNMKREPVVVVSLK